MFAPVRRISAAIRSPTPRRIMTRPLAAPAPSATAAIAASRVFAPRRIDSRTILAYITSP